MSDKDKSRFSRRRALLGLGAASAGLAATACRKGYTPASEDKFGLARNKPYVPGAEAYSMHEERWALSSCGQCPANCGIRVRVVEGRAVRIEGNDKNPVNRGGIGPRGLSGLQFLYDPDRVTGPMARVGNSLQPIEWEDGLTRLADALKRIRSAGQPEKLLFLSGRERGILNELFARFCTVFGSPNFVDGRPARSSVMAQAMDESIGGFELPSYDWGGARYVLGLESGLVEDSCQSIYFVRTAAGLDRDLPGERPRFVQAGPWYDLSAHSSDEWLRLKAGTSGAFALGLCHELLKEFRYDTGFIKRAGVNFEGFEALCKGFTPEYVKKVTGIEPATTSRIAEELWTHRPALAIVDDRSLSYSNAWETARAVLALNALLGAFGAPFGGVHAAPTPPFRPWGEPELDEVAQAGLQKQRLDGAGTSQYPRARSVHATLPEQLGSKDGPEVVLLYQTNPAFTQPQPQQWRDALARVPLVVSFSSFLDETTAAVADLVLPEPTYLENFDEATAAPALPYSVVGLCQPAVRPLHNTRPTGEIILDLAERIGGKVAETMAWTSYRSAVEQRFLGLFDANRGSVTAESRRDFLNKLSAEACWVDSVVEEPPPNLQFKFLARWVEPAFAGDETAYPLKLLVYRPLGHTDLGGNAPWLHVLRDQPGAKAWQRVALVHPDSAEGISDGDQVTIETEWGRIRMPVHVDAHIEPGYVAVPLGGGHTARGRFAEGIGANPMDLLPLTPSRGTGASAVSAARARLVKGGSHG